MTYVQNWNPSASPQASHSQPSNLPVFDLVSRSELKRLSQDEGLSDAEIARMYNVSTNQVNRRRQQMNLIHGGRTADRLAYIVRLSERIKSLPDEAITEIENIVNQYTSHPFH